MKVEALESCMRCQQRGAEQVVGSRGLHRNRAGSGLGRAGLRALSSVSWLCLDKTLGLASDSCRDKLPQPWRCETICIDSPIDLEIRSRTSVFRVCFLTLPGFQLHCAHPLAPGPFLLHQSQHVAFAAVIPVFSHGVQSPSLCLLKDPGGYT